MDASGPVMVRGAPIELRYLRHFVGVVAGSLSAATRSLHITQPALSRSIHLLERRLGTQLLDRQRRGVVPTEAGRLFLVHAQLILNELDSARDEITALNRGTHGTVNLGIASMFANTIIDEAVARLVRRSPGIAVSVTVGLFAELADMLRDGSIDCMFSVMPAASAARGIAFEPLWDISSVIVSAKQHPLALQSVVSKEALQRASWALVDQQQTRAFVDSFFASEGLTAPETVVRTNSLEVIRSLVRQGDFLTFVARHWIEDEVSRGDFVILPAPETPVRRKAGLLYRKVPSRRRAVQALMDEIRSSCRAADPR
jgi:DNA-binding transcriptional LysR family regulator